VFEIRMDDAIILDRSYKPTGLAKDGAASIYESIPVIPGRHDIVASLRDSKREQGFDYSKGVAVNLEPRELLVIDFRKDLDGFNFQ